MENEKYILSQKRIGHTYFPAFSFPPFLNYC